MTLLPPVLNLKMLTRLITLSGIILLAGFYSFSSHSSSSLPAHAPPHESHVAMLHSTTPAQRDNTRPVIQESVPVTEALVEEPAFRDIQYIIKPGDTLEAIFTQQQFSVAELYELLNTDEPYLFLDVLRPGNQLTFQVDESNALHALSLIVDSTKTVAYRHNTEGFSYKETLTPTNKIKQVTRGEIIGSFYISAAKGGLSDHTIMTINQLLQNTLNFRRDLRAGDRFQVVMERETVDGQAIGHDQLLAVRITSRHKDYEAYLHADGSYYDADGNSLTTALLRYPTHKRFRISSPFNPRRRHPVTGRYAPHNGVDFAMPVGTPVIATGDGYITHIANHRYAGKYVSIDEFGPYSTRYLHLSKILVKKGERVKRGQVIGLSGNTGRSTGPHLHYELHIDDKPVNPITAEIPMLKSIAKSDIGKFHLQVSNMQSLMLEDSAIAKHDMTPGKDTRQNKRQQRAQHNVSKAPSNTEVQPNS